VAVVLPGLILVLLTNPTRARAGMDLRRLRQVSDPRASCVQLLSPPTTNENNVKNHTDNDGRESYKIDVDAKRA
jgi:hypothetical protein